MLVSRWLIVTAVILASQTAEAQQSNTLTLACKGTATGDDGKPDPISMGIIINLTAGTVQGFGLPGVMDYPLKMTSTNDVRVPFSGSQELISSVSSIRGSIDRVTGDVEATSTLADPKTHNTLNQTNYALQCKPTQRMF
jgi:hypothetical protein